MTVIAVATTAALAPAAVPPAFEALRWTAPGAEYAMLSEQPKTCLDYPRDKDGIITDGALTVAGHALFNSPALLGGQAAKAGLSCASCHANGRNNVHFHLVGISGQPGTADVTSSFFSAARGNARFDPVPIPDLATPGKISRDRETGALEPFIRNLIVEEFSGAEPGPERLAALAAYVRTIKPCKYEADKAVPRQLSDQTLLISNAILGHKEMIRRGDSETAQLLIAAARHQLHLVNERYSGAKFARERTALLAQSQQLQRLSQIADEARLKRALAQWLGSYYETLLPRLRRQQAQSLYEPALLAKQFPDKASVPSKN